MTVGMPVADASAALRGSLAFLQGNFAGATFPKGPFAQARAIFGGVAPAPPVLRPACAGRPARIANRMTDKALPRPRLLRAVRKPRCAGAPRMLRRGIFPAARGAGRSNRPTTAPGGEKGMMTARTAVAVMAGMLAWYVRSQHAPKPAPGSVSLLGTVFE